MLGIAGVLPTGWSGIRETICIRVGNRETALQIWAAQGQRQEERRINNLKGSRFGAVHVVSRKVIRKGGESHEIRSADILVDDSGHPLYKDQNER